MVKSSEHLPQATRRVARHSTPSQDAILEYLRDYKRDPDNDGNSPTYREIAEYLDKNPADIYRTVQVMIQKGLLKLNKSGKILLVGGRYLPPD